MAKFVKGDVVVVPFPCSDLSQTKRLKEARGWTQRKTQICPLVYARR